MADGAELEYDEAVAVLDDLHERRFDQEYGSTRRSNESFVKPPLLVRGVETEHEPFLSTVSYKVVYDRAALCLPGMVPVVAEDIAGGERARSGSVPLKMALFDRERAFLPISPWHAGSEPVAIIVHGSALADALGALFDAALAQAIPLTLSGEGIVACDYPNRPAAEDLLLLELLRAGLTDEAIARQTGYQCADRRTADAPPDGHHGHRHPVPARRPRAGTRLVPSTT